MKKFFICFLSLLAATMSVLLVSCDDNPFSTEVTDEFNEQEYSLPEEIGDTTVLQINSDEDLNAILSSVADEREKSLLQNGWVKVDEVTQTRVLARAKRQVRIDTVYISSETIDYYSDPSVYNTFNAKFSKSMVDSINKIVSSQYRISAGKTYVCRWKLYSTYYNASSEESVTSRESPLCALDPKTKTAYTKRGYTLYLHETDKLKQYQMNSYQLWIQWEKTPKRR